MKAVVPAARAPFPLAASPRSSEGLAPASYRQVRDGNACITYHG